MNKMSGAEKMALLMCSNFKKYEPIVACGGESLKKAFDDKGIDTYALSFCKKDLLKTLKDLKALIKEKNIFLPKGYELAQCVSAKVVASDTTEYDLEV